MSEGVAILQSTTKKYSTNKIMQSEIKNISTQNATQYSISRKNYNKL